ncbi:unnamed protein product, partial [Chrysoparadoxa australica]
SCPSSACPSTGWKDADFSQQPGDTSLSSSSEATEEGWEGAAFLFQAVAAPVVIPNDDSRASEVCEASEVLGASMGESQHRRAGSAGRTAIGAARSRGSQTQRRDSIPEQQHPAPASQFSHLLSSESHPKHKPHWIGGAELESIEVYSELPSFMRHSSAGSLGTAGDRSHLTWQGGVPEMSVPQEGNDSVQEVDPEEANEGDDGSVTYPGNLSEGQSSETCVPKSDRWRPESELEQLEQAVSMRGYSVSDGS